MFLNTIFKCIAMHDDIDVRWLCTMIMYDDYVDDYVDENFDVDDNDAADDNYDNDNEDYDGVDEDW